MSSNFWNFTELRQMHIELTNACNAACPMCVRFYNNSPLLRPDLTVSQITLDKFKKYFPPEVIRKCHLILFCGVHGDPCIATDIYEICEYIKESSSTTAVRINTNGGMRNAEWWTKFGQLFSERKFDHHYWAVTFSIDGLEDTNHLYRRNVDWQTLMANARAFIRAGGRAVWDYLIFRHNEHQIQQAWNLSKTMGFAEFVPKKALGVDNGTNLTPMPVLDRNGQFDYFIHAPANPENRNLADPAATEVSTPVYSFDKEQYIKIKKENLAQKYFNEQVDRVYEEKIIGHEFDQFDKCKIFCKSNVFHPAGKEIFVDNFGRVMPCCYIGTHLNGLHNDTKTLQLHKHMNDYGWDHFSLEKHTLEEILTSGHLNRVFADSWSKNSIAEGKLMYCADICGQHSRIDRIFTHKINPKINKST